MRMGVKQLISRVSVDAAFFKKLSPMENLLYGARLYGVTAPEATVKAYEIMGRLGLKRSSFNEPMEEMSRGMQQKVAVARAFLTSPILLLLDEPTTGLDPRSKRDVREFIEELRDSHDATILITTHRHGRSRCALRPGRRNPQWQAGRHRHAGATEAKFGGKRPVLDLGRRLHPPDWRAAD